MRSARAATALALLAGAALAALASPRDDAGAAARVPVPGMPGAVAVVPGVGTLSVSWKAPSNVAGLDLTYRVRTVPAGLTCATHSTACTFSVRDATPWRFAVAATDAAGTGPASPLTFAFRHLTVLVVAGQSNALGLESYAVDPATHRSVLAGEPMATASRHSLATWIESGVPDSGIPPVPLSSPQEFTGAQSPVFGPEMGLVARVYGAKHPHVLVVKVAFAGTSLAKDWAPRGALYRHLLTTTRDALGWAAQNWWSATIGGVYWVQGETDAEHPSMAAAYATNLRTLLGTLRRDLRVSPTTPFVLARTDVTAYVNYKRAHHHCTKAQCDAAIVGNTEVRDAQLAVAVADPHVYVVDTRGLPRFPTTWIHLTGRAELRLGQLFAASSATAMT